MEPPELPTVVVAHVPEESEWGRRLYQVLELAIPGIDVQLLALSGVLHENETLDTSALYPEGTAAVVVGSRAFAASGWAGRLGDVLRGAGRRTFWLSIDGWSPAEAMPGHLSSIQPDGGPPLIQRSREDQDRVLRALAEQLATHLGVRPRPPQGAADASPVQRKTAKERAPATAKDGTDAFPSSSYGASAPSPTAPSPSSAAPSSAVELSRLAGFAADTVAGEDRLDVSREALTLAMVLAHKEVFPPISVGLFGDWGSGKSFFMAQMRSWVAKLAEESRRSKGSFCERVVQLEFNAWHYMDSNLWASLAREIFEGLANAVADTESKEVARERLLRATQSTKDVIAATEGEIREKEQALDAAQQRLAEVERSTPDAVDVAGAAVRAALELPEIQQPLRRAVRELHLDEGARSLEELKEELDGMTGVARQARAVGVALRRRWPGVALGLAAAAIATGLAYWVTSRHAADVARWVSGLTALVGAFLAAVGPVRKTAAQILGRVADWQRAVEGKLAAEQRAREAEIRQQVESHARELNALRDRRRETERRLGELRDVRASLDKLNQTKQLIDFIRQRDSSSDYRAQLGVVARASQDFRRLSQLMSAAAEAREGGQAPGAGPPMPSVDRIVLYIDDLDRCPEDKVVDVLQAVHLLLAYPIFVVVVGVDPRWLLHSLEQHSRGFQRDGEVSAEAPRDASWRSTALDYLEKIFQIPYTLRPMERAGFGRLIRDLATVEPPPVPSLPGASAAAGTPAPVPAQPSVAAALVPGGPSAGAAGPAHGEGPAVWPGGAVGLDLHPRALRLEEEERACMTRLFELIPTPRAAKRFVNVYRLIRASIDRAEDLRTFLDTREYLAVQLLLAMVTGAPAEAAEVLGDLLAVPEATAAARDFWAVVDGVLERHEEANGWSAFAARLRSIRAAPDVPRTCEPYRKWADDVARYSFYSGRILLGPQPRVREPSPSLVPQLPQAASAPP